MALNDWQKERCVLITFFLAMNGKNWRNNSGWNTPLDHCGSWNGVNCSTSTNLVEELNLVDNDLTGIWTSNLALPNLKVLMLNRNQMRGDVKNYLPTNATLLVRLSLSFNNLSGCLPWQLLTQYKYLEKLQLGNNRYIKGIIDDSVATLEKLGVLSLGQTGVSGHISSGITKLKNLWFLDLEALNVSGNISFLIELPLARFIHLKSNKLHGELPQDIGDRMVHMMELNLKHNQLTGQIPESFSMMTSLTVLDLSSNKFTGQVPSSVLQLKLLSTLDLSSNKFETISSNLSLPAIYSLSLANNIFKMTALQLVTALKKMNDYRTLKILDISSCRLAGPMPSEVWDFTNLMILNVSRNYFGHDVPSPRDELPSLILADLSYNNFTGTLPQALSLLIAIKELDLRYNFNTSRMRDLPAFAKPDNDSTTRESPADHFTCPVIRFNAFNGGILLIDSSYYGGVYCSCDPGYYGHHGRCHKCFDNGQCNGRQNDSRMGIPPNYYPIPTADNAMSFIRCSSYYHDTLHCNPYGTCSCWLSSNDSKTICDSVCVHNTTGFLCSHCQDGYYKHGDGCLPCSSDDVTVALVVTAIACLLIPVPGWLLQRTWPHLGEKRLFNIVFRLGGVILPSVIIISLGLTQIIPTYAAEFYLLSVFLATLDRLKSVRAFAFTLFIYFQVLDSLDVCSYSTDCEYCSFAGLLDYFDIDKVARVVNFQFSGVTCLIPPLGTPLGRLIFLSTAPLVLSFLVIVAHLLDYYVVTLVCCRHADVDFDRIRSRMMGNCKRAVILFLNVFYYPVAVAAIKVFPCQAEQGGNHMHMSAYPWIRCDSGTQYRNLVILASLVVVFYVCALPLLFALLFHKYHQTNLDSNEQLLGHRCQDEVHVDQETGDGVWLRAICYPFKEQYQRYVPVWSVVLMLRRLLVAGLLAIFHDRQSNILAMPLTVVLLSSILLIGVARPYRTTSRWELESVADVGAFCVILVTYTSMASRHDVSFVTAVSVFGLNVLFILAVVSVAVIRSLFEFNCIKRCRRTSTPNVHHQCTTTYGSITPAGHHDS